MSVSILAVDDETDVADLFRQHFRPEVRQGQYVLHFAHSREDTLGLLAKGVEPQLIAILSDINRHRRPYAAAGDQRSAADLPVIMVTAYGEEERRRRASEHGAADFITKPVDFDALKAQLQQSSAPRA